MQVKLQFPAGFMDYTDINGKHWQPDANGQVTIPDANLLQTMLTAGFIPVVTTDAITQLTDGVTITPDFSLGEHFTVTLGGNRTLANPTNMTIGQTGSFRVAQDGTGNRTLAFGTYYKFASGSKTMSTGASAIDVIVYRVVAAGEILCELNKAYA